MRKKTAVIFLNGKEPDIKIINKILSKKSLTIISADGATDYLYKHSIIPDVIIGDMDSISPKTYRYFKSINTNILKLTEQETTDYEKALNFAKKSGFKNIFVCGAVSNRIDHTFNNFSVTKRFHPEMNIKLINDEFEIFYFDKSITFKYKKNEIVSFLGIPIATGVKTEGLKYPLKNESLEFGVREGTLNESVSNIIKISYKKGSMLLFKKHYLK
ncbi:MAG TPA: thiamine diphosphokinase [Ignavibacteria bacterium]|nr:thiamine diphosphokinase [Ignavibacteria bacterium]